MDLHSPSINNVLDTWLNEDLGRGDLTAESIENNEVAASWIAKGEGIFCGGEIVTRIFHKLDHSINIKLLVNDGENFTENQEIMKIKGPSRALLAGERTALNIAMRLSGISTATAILIKELTGTQVKLADTRKTTPGLRVLEKYAFRCGGGINHRLGLDDAAMLKENHLAWSGGIKKALTTIRTAAPWPCRVIVEAENSDQAKNAAIAGADGILLDEMSPEILIDLVPELRNLAKESACNTFGGAVILEASGIKSFQLKEYAKTGIDLISTSAPMTKSDWVDFSMRFCNHA
tara:strand:- start:185 stop:1057 length:873 start_codon:yes stop_codon:yes gene_type:complete